MTKLTMLPALLLLALSPAACVDDDALTSLEGLVRWAEETIHVETVQCQTTTPSVGETVRCTAYSDGGRVLRVDGQSVVRWSVSDPTVAEIDLDGEVVVHEAASVNVIAEDPNGGTASLTLDAS